ncbi:MAG: putative protein YqeY [Ignavibacteria bacterium]|nr:putative protein YqeY [Ignavibacteria bacterium]
MSLKDKINIDLNNAIKAKDSVRIDTLRSIRAEILKMDKSGMNREMTQDEEIQLLNKQAKMRKEAMEMFLQGGRQELVDREKLQLDVINEYLPKQMSENEAKAVVDNIIINAGEVTQKDFGKIMGEVMKQLKGKIDGKIIQDLVKSKLS